MEIVLALVPPVMIGAAIIGLGVYLPYRCIRYGWRQTLYGFVRSF
jgi:hypothetical protein